MTTVNSSASVVGVGTAWLGQVSAGDLFTVDRVTFYKVAMVVGDGSLTLTTPYGGPSAADQVYGIVLNGEAAATGLLSAAATLLTPADRVTSVFDRIGAVTAQAGDYTAAQVTVTPSGGIAATEVQGALAELDTEKAALAGAAFTGAVTAPTPETGDNSTRLATTAFVKAQGYITAAEAPVLSVAGKTGVVTLVVADVAGAAPLASPALTGTPTAPTAEAGTSTTQIATTAFVRGQGYITAAEAPVLSVAGKTGVVTLDVADVSGAAPLASPVLTGTPTAPTPAASDNSTTLATTAFVKAQTLNDLAAPIAALSINGQRLVNVADPSGDQDAATKAYVDSVAQGLDAKASVRAATTANVTLSGTQTIDSVAVGAGDRVLVKNQTSPAENGIYVAASGAWARSADANSWNELVSAYVFVEGGTVNANAGFTCTVQPGGTLGTTPVTWVQFSGAGQVIAGTGLLKDGNTLSVDTTVIAALASPALTGTPTAPTAGIDTNTTQLATTAFVIGQGYLKTATAATIYAPLASPALTGTPTAPTAAVDTSTTQLATTAFVVGQGYLKSATAAAIYAPLASPTFTGTPVISGTAPELRLRETDQTLPAGLWRWLASGNELLLQKNTAAAGDFSTAITPLWVNNTGNTVFVISLSASGNTTLGDASSDTVTVNGTATFVAAPSAPTAAVDTNTTQLATTAFVIGQASAAGDGNPAMNGTAARGTSTHYARADHVHPTDTSRAPLASPALTGTPTAPTATTGDSSTQIATTAFVKNQGYVTAATAPVLSVAGKTGVVTLVVGDVSGAAPLASPALTGTPTAPTQAASDNSTKIATTAFVKNQNSASLAMAYAAALCF